MPTTKIERKTEKEIEVYPAAELVSAINRMLKEKIPVKIALVSDESGDVAFIATLNDLGITRQVFHSHPFFRSNIFTNIFGELLVRGNLDLFASRILDKNNYDALVKKYNHKDMGLRSKGDDILMFQFHISLIYRLLNESISWEIADEVSKITISCPKKVKREDENISVTTYPDDENNLHLVVTKGSEIRATFQQAIASILNYYKIKGKQVFVTSNLFNYEIQIKNQ